MSLKSVAGRLPAGKGIARLPLGLEQGIFGTRLLRTPAIGVAK